MAFECIACAEEHDSTPITLANHPVCSDCFKGSIVPMFHDALNNETKRPVKVDGVPLNPHDYAAFFDEEFLKNWDAKKTEFNTPVQHRLYCRGSIDFFDTACGAFLGTKTEREGMIVCTRCRGSTCTKCGEPLTFMEKNYGLHSCRTQTEEAENPFAGMKRGEDYQICPQESCQVKVGLAAGCNHMRCPFCGTQMCFICGSEATERSGHWDVGNPCPRFGKKGNARAIHDPLPRRAGILNRLLHWRPRRRGLNRQGEATDDLPLGDPAVVAAQIQDQERILATPEGRLFTSDHARLDRLHTRITFIEDTTPSRNRTTQAWNQTRDAHNLLHHLEIAIEVYITDLRRGTAPRRPLRESAVHRHINHRITAYVERLGNAIGRFPELQGVLTSYNEAWAGRMEQLWAGRDDLGDERLDDEVD
ncbi:Hypothetical predicted protein [Lecanosticta acicola]|uniref:RBR-type E3 ubiquitin transferase n=1 Tax=Lecanosticta acicola TaxID=111012 RepID=A0AAI8YXF3_9PEZI|nr:Hypothetical predicted protein [Lecanosticta acicola]